MFITSWKKIISVQKLRMTFTGNSSMPCTLNKSLALTVVEFCLASCVWMWNIFSSLNSHDNIHLYKKMCPISLLLYSDYET